MAINEQVGGAPFFILKKACIVNASAIESLIANEYKLRALGLPVLVHESQVDT